MKKFTIAALAICLAFALAAPVMAVDTDFSGSYRARGFYTSHWDLRDTSASNAYMDMRFRLQTVFKVNDILSVTTRFDALDRVFGSATGDTGSMGENIDFDRAYMTIKADFGKFDIGRMSGGAWGTSFVDNEGERDRIKYTKTIDDLTLYAVFQKNVEADNDPGLPLVPGDDAADQDSDTYYLLGKYKMENITPGLLLAFTNGKTDPAATTHKYTAMPYFVAKFGPLDIQGELAYNWGETDYDGAATDLDIKELAYNLEATYNFGPASVMAGYAFVSGDDVTDPDEDSGYGGVGADWEKLFILTYDESPVNALGGLGNLSSGMNIFGVDFDPGAKIFYGGVNATPIEDLTLGFVFGMADADEAPLPNQEDDYGIEYDLTLNWKIYDNLTYTAIVAYLDAGDFWKGGVSIAEVENTYAMFHQLKLSF